MADIELPAGGCGGAMDLRIKHPLNSDWQITDLFRDIVEGVSPLFAADAVLLGEWLLREGLSEREFVEPYLAFRKQWSPGLMWAVDSEDRALAWKILHQIAESQPLDLQNAGFSERTLAALGVATT